MVNVIACIFPLNLLFVYVFTQQLFKGCTGKKAVQENHNLKSFE